MSPPIEAVAEELRAAALERDDATGYFPAMYFRETSAIDAAVAASASSLAQDNSLARTMAFSPFKVLQEVRAEGEKLTVSLWHAARPGAEAGAHTERPQRALLEAGQ